MGYAKASVVRRVPDARAREVQARAALAPIHYREAFAISTDAHRRPEDWARLMLEGAQPRKRRAMLRTWALLGVKLADLTADGQVLGWTVRHSDDDVVVLEVTARIGLTARLVLATNERTLVQAMVVRYDRRLGRLTWLAVAPLHRSFICGLLHDVMSAGR
jgi:hypothetical protein